MVIVTWQRLSVDDAAPVGRVTQTHLAREGTTDNDKPPIPLACGRSTPGSWDAAVDLFETDDDVRIECPKCRKVQTQRHVEDRKRS
jgi:hypothetical protein